MEQSNCRNSGHSTALLDEPKQHWSSDELGSSRQTMGSAFQHPAQGIDDSLDVLLPMTTASNLDSLQKKPDILQQRNTTDPAEAQDAFLPVSIPTSSNELCTFSYQQALSNRIRDCKLARNAEYDPKIYTPTFVHDCLMFPGVLANVIGKADHSTLEIVHRMTPALLPGHRAYINQETHLPCILPSSRPSDYVQGMVVFGQSRKRRDRIHAYYRPDTRRVKVDVEIDVVDPMASTDRTFGARDGELRRRKLAAHVWLWTDLSVVDTAAQAETPAWNVGDFLEGKIDVPALPDRSVESPRESAGSEEDSDFEVVADEGYWVIENGEKHFKKGYMF